MTHSLRYLSFYLFLLVPYALPAQMAQGYIYGKVVLKNGETYRGQLRWDDEEALWDDIFDAHKYERPMQNLLSPSEARQVASERSDFKFGFMELWADKSPEMNFSFRGNFGDLVSLRAVEGNVILLYLKNGKTIKLKSGRGADLKEHLVVYDRKVGRLRLDFDDIRTVHFQSAPEGHISLMGAPIYGEVLTTLGVFKGYITWDGEERLGKDLISGYDKGTKVDIEFKDIAAIKAQDDGALVELRSGRTLFLNNHDDVSRGNHGITIRGQAFGSLEVSWRNFISASFTPPPVPPPAYDDFDEPLPLKGRVVTKGGATLTGQIVYDLDEIYNTEILNGANNGFEYHIPFRHVSRIEPQNDKFSMVYLKDGTQYLLSENPDVTADNHGIILKLPYGRARYLSWSEIKNIYFE